MKKLHIYLDNYCQGPNFVMVNGHPAYPHLETGKSYVFPLTPDGDRWKLIANEGWGLVVPAIQAEPTSKPPASKRDFIVREIMNALLRGSHADLYQFSLYMQFRPAAELNDEIMADLTGALPDGDPRWLDPSTALLATIGVPRRGLDGFVAGRTATTFADANVRLAVRTLQEVPESHRREDIVRSMLQ